LNAIQVLNVKLSFIKMIRYNSEFVKGNNRLILIINTHFFAENDRVTYELG